MKRLELLREAVPRAKRVAFISGSFASSPIDWSAADAAVRATGITPVRYVLTNIDQLTSTLAAVARDRPDALIPGSSGISIARRKEIAEFALQQRLPTIFHLREGAEVGGLMAYGVNLTAGFRRAADYVARILGGAKPADLPVEQPTRLDLVINLKTAKALGLTIPQSLLLRADDVIQ
jgi:putative ABC transport system substrate-binding protein